MKSAPGRSRASLAPPKNEKAVCAFVRSIVSAATASEIRLIKEPDRENRSTKDVEELWESPTLRFAIEHTLLESLPDQILDNVRFEQVFAPLRAVLKGRLPGTYDLRVELGALSSTSVDHADVRKRIAERVLQVAETLEDGRAVKLDIEQVPFPVLIRKRNGYGSRLSAGRWTNDDIEPRRLERIRRALDAKCPKLARASADGRVSILALESNDIVLANWGLVASAVEDALVNRTDVPSIVILVETDGGPFYGWTLWNKTNIELNDSYFEGQF